MELKTFNPLAISSKFTICGLPIRVDTYRTCSFGCEYCFSNCRKVMEFEKMLQVGNICIVENKLKKIFNKRVIDNNNLLDVFIAKRITWHGGGMSDPFQPCEEIFGITKQLIDVTSKYDIDILFSTKSDSVYECNINPNLHSFQLSVTNVDNRKDLEPNVADISKRLKFYQTLKRDGFKVGIRIQPFIPTVSTLEIIKTFEDADNFTLEGLKLVPQNLEHINLLTELLGLKREDFTCKGLMCLKPEIRLKLYKPFIDYFEAHNIPYSIADNDLRYLGTNTCCCGDRLVKQSSGIDITAMIKKYGLNWKKEQVDNEIACIKNCSARQYVTSNRTMGVNSVQDYYDKRFNTSICPLSPKFQYVEMNENA